MATLDYIVIAILLVSAIAGLIQGFLREICSLIAWVLGIWLAWKFAPALAPKLGGALKDPTYGLWAARAIIFVAILVVGAIIGATVNYFVRLSIFSGTDRLLGFVLGLARGVVIVGVGIILAQAVKVDGEAWWQKSRVVSRLEPVANLLRGLAGDHLPGRAAGDTSK
jgi:membrane protein required for colicin V production